MEKLATFGFEFSPVDPVSTVSSYDYLGHMKLEKKFTRLATLIMFGHTSLIDEEFRCKKSTIPIQTVNAMIYVNPREVDIMYKIMTGIVHINRVPSRYFYDTETDLELIENEVYVKSRGQIKFQPTVVYYKLHHLLFMTATELLAQFLLWPFEQDMRFLYN